MGVTSDGKWVSVDDGAMPVAEAAEVILNLRVADVQAALPLAAAPSEDIEPVHQLRVSCRRAAAAVRAFRDLAPRRARRAARWLKRIRRAAGPARDADVLLVRLDRDLPLELGCADAIRSHVRDRRAAAQQDLESAARRAARGGFERARDKFLRAVRRADEAEARAPIEQFARQQLDAAAQRTLAVDVGEATFDELHQLRIAAKRWRYSIELFHALAPPAVRDEAYPIVEEMQDRLGTLNDRVVAQTRWQAWLGELPPDACAAGVAGLVVAEHDAARRLREEFLAWYLPEKRAALQDYARLTAADL